MPIAGVSDRVFLTKQYSIKEATQWATNILTLMNGKLYTFLRQGHRKRRKKHGSLDRRGQIPDRRPINERPKAVDKRQEFGHWEGDTVVGKSNGSSIATHVERKSRYLLVGKTDDKSAESMNSTTQQLFRASVFPKRHRF